MKIVYCIPALYNSGGMERVLSAKANALVQMGHDIHIVTTDQKSRSIFFPLDGRIEVTDLGINYEDNNQGSIWSKAINYPGKSLNHRRRLRQLLRELRADIVVSMFGEEASFLPEIKDGSHKVLEYHFSKLKRLQYGRTGLWRCVDEWRTRMDEKTVRRYERFVVLTQEDKSLWGDLPNIRVIPNPLPFDSDKVSPLDSKRVIAAGRYDFQKNFEALIRIWSRIAPHFPEWKLDIFGDGSLRESLQAQVDRLGLSDSLTLACPTKEMPSEYMRSSIYVMTSRYEGLPMVLLEAQTFGLPIVSFACQCGPRDVIEDGEDGYLVELSDEDTFAQKLTELMQDEDLRRQMGRRARIASRRYLMERVMPQWLELFEEVMRSK